MRKKTIWHIQMCTSEYALRYCGGVGSQNHIGVRELRAEIATYLKRAASGDRIIVTLDGHPIAQIGPLEPEGEPTLDDLVAAGLLNRPKNEDKPPHSKPALTPIDISIDRILQELRGT